MSADGETEELPFDLETAIRVCRQAGFFEHASYLAKKYNRHEDYLQIQIEDAGNYKDALTYLRRLGTEAVSALYGYTIELSSCCTSGREQHGSIWPRSA